MGNTTFLQEPEPLDREQSIEAYVKLRLQSLDRAVAGYASVSLQGLSGNVDLSPTQAKNRVVKLTGAPSGAVTVRIPATTGANADIHFVNICTGSSANVTVKSTGANTGNSAGVVVAGSHQRTVWHDGESAYPLTPLLSLAGEVPSARAYHNTTQGIPNATWTVYNLNSERWDTAGMHDNSTNNSRLTCKAAGLYAVGAAVQVGAGAAGNRYLQLIKNGADNVEVDGTPNFGASENAYLSVSTHFRLALNDYVEGRIYQGSGGSLSTVVNSGIGAELWMTRVGD